MLTLSPQATILDFPNTGYRLCTVLRADTRHLPEIRAEERGRERHDRPRSLRLQANVISECRFEVILGVRLAQCRRIERPLRRSMDSLRRNDRRSRSLSRGNSSVRATWRQWGGVRGRCIDGGRSAWEKSANSFIPASVLFFSFCPKLRQLAIRSN